MIRVLELLVSLVIVAVLVVVIGVLLPSHGHVERSVEVSNPVRQIYDSLNTLRRFPEWSAERRLDPQLNMEFEGPREGVDAGVRYSGNELVGKGSLKIVSSDPDSQVKMAVENHFAGTDKSYTIRIEPSQSGKTARIFWSYDVDYGWNLLWRYAGLYIHGAPDANVQAALGNLSAMLASFPNVDYKDQDIKVVDVAASPLLFVSTKAPRTLDEVGMATDEATAKLEAFIKKAGLTATGPRRTITTNWGDENYVFDVAIPVSSATFTVDKKDFTIPATPGAVGGDVLEGADDDADAPKTFAPGDIDGNGHLVLDGEVRGVMGYAGKALTAEYTGSAAALPLLRLMEKAWAETHGYGYSEMDDGRFWDELVPPAPAADGSAASAGEETWRVYLPVSE
ncbi:MAG: polyketide cyclase [Xanthomonadales bacterium]|nr:polyketide cyclase [Xanthomonadales bacterium]